MAGVNAERGIRGEFNDYGYLIWKMTCDGFALVGMADQCAICDPQTDFILIITSENPIKKINYIVCAKFSADGGKVYGQKKLYPFLPAAGEG